MNLRYDQEYFSCVFVLFKTSSPGFQGVIQEHLSSNSILIMFFSGYSLGHMQVVHLSFWERIR